MRSKTRISKISLIFVELLSLHHLRLELPFFADREELVEGFSMLRNSLDKEGYVGSRLNVLEFSSVAKTTGTLFVDFDRMNPEGEDYFHGQALYLFQKGADGTEIIGIAVLDDDTVSSWND